VKVHETSVIGPVRNVNIGSSKRPVTTAKWSHGDTISVLSSGARRI
jgi:hypothetical protein